MCVILAKVKKSRLRVLKNKHNNFRTKTQMGQNSPFRSSYVKDLKNLKAEQSPPFLSSPLLWDIRFILDNQIVLRRVGEKIALPPWFGQDDCILQSQIKSMVSPATITRKGLLIPIPILYAVLLVGTNSLRGWCTSA